MIHLTPSDLTEANVWINELPNGVQLSVDSVRSLRLDATPHQHDTIRIVVEMLKRLGPRQSYGLLGLLFSSRSDTSLIIEVPERCRNTECYDTSLVRKVSDEPVIVGLPEWAVEPVFSTIAEHPRLNQLGPGHLAIDCCAAGTRSSNANMFKVLTNTLIDYLVLACPSEQSEMKLLEVLRSRIT
jgi:hypothetical protein